MVEIKPFKGYRYDLVDLSPVISPPYDVIDRKAHEALLERSPHNFVRLILGDDPGAEDGLRDVAAVGRRLDDWIERGVLRQDPEPSLYVYSQVFTVDGGERRRTGLITLVRLEGFGERHIFPHEKVIPRHVEDRYLLMEATGANLGLIFGLYADPSRRLDRLLGEIMKAPPTSRSDTGDVLHELWRTADPGLIRQIQGMMAAREVYLADGHHRYTTALRYRDAHPERPGAAYVMMDLVNLYDEGLVILPTHRLIAHGDYDAAVVREKIEEHYRVKSCPMERVPEEIRNRKFTYGFYCEGRSYVIGLKDPRILDTIRTRSEALKRLDVTVLQETIFRPVFGIHPDDPEIQKKITYVKGTQAALERLATEAYPFGFFVNAVTVEEIVRVARDHEVMPQKSSFFHPKVYSGLVVHKIE